MIIYIECRKTSHLHNSVITTTAYTIATYTAQHLLASIFIGHGLITQLQEQALP